MLRYFAEAFEGFGLRTLQSHLLLFQLQGSPLARVAFQLFYRDSVCLGIELAHSALIRIYSLSMLLATLRLSKLQKAFKGCLGLVCLNELKSRVNVFKLRCCIVAA